ncbi:hypothetical protein [Streptomyces sp. NPDC051109]|uniref:hypothetical protein n=1 Tax=Streptomyces sp. NPDC051109 TaxID=3365642 RepID=UPI00379A1A0C
MPSKTLLYRVGYLVTAPLFPLLRRFAPNLVTTTEALGPAMIAVARTGAVSVPGSCGPRTSTGWAGAPRTSDNSLSGHPSRT